MEKAKKKIIASLFFFFLYNKKRKTLNAEAYENVGRKFVQMFLSCYYYVKRGAFPLRTFTSGLKPQKWRARAKGKGEEEEEEGKKQPT